MIFKSLLMTLTISRHVQRRKVVRASRVSLDSNTEIVEVRLCKLHSVAQKLLIDETFA